jgi:DnaK suppressor protein
MPKIELEKEKKQRREFLRQAAEKLEETKKQLLKEIQGRRRGESEAVKDEGRDTYDLASDERDREINFILNDREREKLFAIDEALKRIKEKTYGICESCEGEIQVGRLKVLPFTRLCVKCQEENEKESKRQKTLDDERGYRKLVINDFEEEGF